MLKIIGATGNNLQKVSAEIPVGLMTCITGVSGSGKSTLINATLYPNIAHHLNNSSLKRAPVEKIEGLDFFDKVVDVNHSPQFVSYLRQQLRLGHVVIFRDALVLT